MYLSLNEKEPEDENDYGYSDAVFDDLMGNTSHLTSTPTPTPVYLGHKYEVYYNAVAVQMKRYKEAIAQMDAEKDEHAVLEIPASLNDHAISMVVRSYRDKHGTRLKPVGVAKTLELLLKDLELPVSTFGEETFTSILTCCTTPAEARRIFRLMKDVQHPISSYSWSILVDIHAKLGDFQGCDQVMREMVMEGVSPTLPAYTSLLAACYKTCVVGNIPHSVRADAGRLAWAKWKEMRILGVEADAMAFGAMLRICAARGHAEKALNLLDEMVSFEIKPTTLCFSAALKAIARSHHIAIRYENGASIHYRKRQEVAAHHGKMARQVVIAAEGSEVELDDGFVANLILCAGAAGDSSTAKAILLASEVRRLDHLRTIGSNEHLARLGGSNESDSQTIDARLSQQFAIESSGVDGSMLEMGMNELTSFDAGSLSDEIDRLQAFGEREYGRDSRVLSALMQACSQAIDSRGLGTMWEGRDNKGYLCENSLLNLTVKPKPKYMDNTIPGVSSTKVGLGSLTYDEEDPDYMSKRLRRAKFMGIDMDDSGTNMDDLDPYLYNMFKADDPILNRENPDAIQELLPLDDPAWDIRPRKAALVADDPAWDVRPRKAALVDAQPFHASSQVTHVPSQVEEEWFFDLNERKWKTRFNAVEHNEKHKVDASTELESEDFLHGQSPLFLDATTGTVKNIEGQHRQQDPVDETTEEWYFDQSKSKWATRPRVSKDANLVQPVSTQDEVESLTEGQGQSVISYQSSESNYSDTGDSKVRQGADRHAEEAGITMSSHTSFAKARAAPKIEFSDFVELLSQEIKESGEELNFTEEEAWELYNDMADEITLPEKGKGLAKQLPDEFDFRELDDEHKQLMNLMQSMGIDASLENRGVEGHAASELSDQDEFDEFTSALSQLTTGTADMGEGSSSNDLMSAYPVDEGDYLMAELQLLLEGMPERRIRQVARAFENSLGSPSLLTLTPILRENMPERVTSAWLKRKNIQNAYFVMKKAKEDGLTDVHMMNGMLQVECSSGSLDRALSCHETRFKQNGLEPTQYSDRLVLQMLIENQRHSRALQFKEKVEASGRTLDVLSYGSLIEYYARNRQIGSALIMLKECVSIHGSPPNEHSLNALRRLCRHQHLTEKTELVKYAGPDPLEWLREGEATLKREYSKKGRRDVLLPRNKSVNI